MGEKLWRRVVQLNKGLNISVGYLFRAHSLRPILHLTRILQGLCEFKGADMFIKYNQHMSD